MDIPTHQIENVLRAYKKSLISRKNGISKNLENRFNEKKRILRNKILMDIGRRISHLEPQTYEIKPSAGDKQELLKTRIEYKIIGPDGKVSLSIDLPEILNS